MHSKFFGINQLKELLPYRYPLLMLDRAASEDENHYTGYKNLSFNELFFQGHFPDHPVMPGVLQIEAMKQLAQLAVADRIDPERSRDIYIKVMEKVKFRKPNLPGDRMQVDVKVESVEGTEAIVNAQTSNSQGLACQAKLTLATRPLTEAESMPQMYNEFDRNDEILMQVTEIMKAVPHRYPFLLIDNIVKNDGPNLTAVKNTTINEPIFQGFAHDYPVLPGSIQAEIMAQAGCAAVLSRPENSGKIAYFMSIDRAEFLAPIYPGDQLVCEIVIPEGKSRFGKGHGHISVDNKRVCEVKLTFAIVDP